MTENPVNLIVGRKFKLKSKDIVFIPASKIVKLDRTISLLLPQTSLYNSYNPIIQGGVKVVVILVALSFNTKKIINKICIIGICRKKSNNSNTSKYINKIKFINLKSWIKLNIRARDKINTIDPINPNSPKNSIILECA